MRLLLARHLWGMDGSLEELFPRIQEQGYEAIETVVPEATQQAHFKSLLERYNFGYIAQIHTQGNSVDEHLASFRAQVKQAKALQPLFINCHSGRDTWSLDESVYYFEQALAIEEAEGIQIAHETHRGRILFHPVITRYLLERFTALKLCCDFSHWVCVSERIIDDQLDTLKLCGERCIHLHTRVGYEEGPQVPDPRAPEFLPYVEAHERWWQMVWDLQEQRGMQVSTLVPEFGPPGYMHTLPYTQVPVANLEDICNWQAHREAELFARRKER